MDREVERAFDKLDDRIAQEGQQTRDAIQAVNERLVRSEEKLHNHLVEVEKPKADLFALKDAFEAHLAEHKEAERVRRHRTMAFWTGVALAVLSFVGSLVLKVI